MGYYHPVAKKGNQADIARKYGVAGVRSPRPGMEGGALGGRRTVNDVERDISAAMANDYDTREFLKYNEDARKEMKNGVPSNRKQNEKLHEMMQDAHKENGNGGEFSSAADFAGVAQGAFETYEKNERQDAKKYVDRGLGQLQEQFDKMRGAGDDQQSAQAATPIQSAEASEIDEWFKNDPTSYSFDPAGQQPAAAQPVTPQSEGEAATLTVGNQPGADQAKLNEYKLKVKEGMKIAGVQTRGPQSGVTPGGGF